MIVHKDFEILCTVAATGQITGRDREALTVHCESCSDCRSLLLEMTLLNERLLVNTEPKPGAHEIPSGMQRRFMERATKEGLLLRKMPPALPLQGGWFGAPIATVVILLAVTFTNLRNPSRSQNVRAMARGSVAHTRRNIKANESSAVPITQAVHHGSLRKHRSRNAHTVALPLAASKEKLESVSGKERPRFYFPLPEEQRYPESAIPLRTPSAAALITAIATNRNPSDENAFSAHLLPARFLNMAFSIQPAKRVFRYEAGIASLNLSELPGVEQDLALGLKPGIRPLRFQRSTEQ
jgi:hypothetical protein